MAIHLRDEMLGDLVGDDGAGLALAVPALMLTLWALAHGSCVQARRAMLQGRGFGPYLRAQRVVGLARALGLVIFAFGVVALGWLGLVRRSVGDVVLLDELIATSPYLALLVALWWSVHPLDRLVREAMLIRSLDEGLPVHPLPARHRALWASVRHELLLGLLPGSLATAWGECVPWMTARVLGGMRGAPLGVREFVEPSLAFMGLLLIMTVVPAMLRWLWDVVRIEEGQVRAMAREACERHGVRVVGPLLWRTHGAMVNAAILGLFWPLRYLLVTDALLEAMPKRQLEGVLAHEVAHVRLAHIAWLGASVVASASALGWLVGAVVWMWPATGDVGAARDEETLATAAMLGSAAALGATLLTLGYVSRRFEWQADAFAVRHLSVSDGSNAGVTPQAAADMSGALATVASANGVPESRWGFRHGSIADRRMRVERLVGVALDAFEIDRVVRRIKWMIVLTIVVSVVAAVLPAVA